MTRTISHARTALLAACLFTGGLAAGLVPAQAQWIGTPGGSGDDAAATAPATTPAPEAAPAPAPAMAPATALPTPDMSQPMPGGFSPGGFSPGGFAAPAPQSGPSQADMADCQAQIGKLRSDLEARNETLRKAAERKVPPSEICPLFRGFATAQQKFYSYLNTNKTKCGVPDEALKDLRQNNTQVASVRDKVCQAAQAQQSGGGGPPPQGAVAAGLGLSSGLPNVDGGKGGVFDTLGGSALR